MKDNRLFRLGIILMFAFVIVVLIKQNVTATKENPGDPGESIAALNLEVNSELVQQVYSSLILLNNRILDDEIYRYAYFNINDKDTLSNEEKLYIAFESLYKNDKFNKEINDGVETLKISEENVKNEISTLFKDNNFDSINLNYKSSINCGIVDYLFTGNSYELKFKKCDENHRGIDRTKLESAVKDGNFIRLTIKSFYATKNKKHKEKYDIKNYTNDDVVDTLEKIDDEIINKIEIDKYVFSFELRGESYYLDSIKKA